MNANGAKGRRVPSRGSVWPWILGIGCVLVILIAMVLPRQARRTGLAGTAAEPGGGAPAGSGNGGTGLRSHARAGALAGPTAQEIVAAKVSQFAQKRWQTVQAMARHFKVEVPAEVKRFFEAVQAGRQEEADALFKSMSEKRKSPSTTSNTVEGLQKLWPAVMETYGVTKEADKWPPQKLLDYGNAVLDSLRPDMVYLGGTDPGRFIPTLLNETSDASPHAILTQNAFADGAYLDYVRFLYGDQMAMPTPDESQRAFQDYIADATQRLQHDEQFPDEPKQLRPGEEVQMIDGRIQVSGEVAVMGINELMLQTLMQKNPDASFALEESFPLKSTYADATTLGPIMELGHQDAQAALTPERASQSLDYWRTTTQELLDDPDTPEGSTPRNAYAKLLVSQANLFLDRNYSDQAEGALRLATELNPANPEAVYNYAGLLAKENRFAEASQLVQTALTLAPANQGFQTLLQTLNKSK
jgi:tetratricopeptide (TPR) repeat protein